MDYIIRKVQVDDASPLVDYVNQVSGESDNLTFGLGEFNMILEDEESFIQSLSSNDNAVMFIAVKEKDIIGQLHYAGGKRNRVRHVGEFGLTVRKDFWGQGIGEALLISLIDWAKSSPYCEKINLRVRDDNFNAIALYRKCGFKVEGLSKRDMKINDVFIDSLYMGLEIEKQ